MPMSAGLEQFLLALAESAQRLAARHRRGADALIALVIAVASFIGLVVQGRLGHVDVSIFCVCLCAPLLLRGRSRTLCFALVTGLSLIQWLVSTPQLADTAVLVALYWVALDGELAR